MVLQIVPALLAGAYSTGTIEGPALPLYTYMPRITRVMRLPHPLRRISFDDPPYVRTPGTARRRVPKMPGAISHKRQRRHFLVCLCARHSELIPACVLSYGLMTGVTLLYRGPSREPYL